MSYFHKVERCNRRDMRHFVPFLVDGRQYGWLTHGRADAVLKLREVFKPLRGGLTFQNTLSTPAKRSRAVAEAASELAATGLFPKPRGEIYAVKNHWSEPAVFRIDRALNPGFGLRSYGVHLNGVVEKKSGPHLWIGTRAKDMLVEPGKLDNMVAGGQPAHLSLTANLVKECGEEAHLSAKVARMARAVGVLNYSFASPQGLRCDTLFCYDLAMPQRLVPRPSEEISRYDLMPLTKILKTVRTTDRFKFNVNVVIIDLAIRRGIITAENEPDFERIVAGLHERPV